MAYNNITGVWTPPEPRSKWQRGGYSERAVRCTGCGCEFAVCEMTTRKVPHGFRVGDTCSAWACSPECQRSQD